MPNFASVDSTTTCPVTGADGSTTIRVFGKNGDTIYKEVTCPEGHVYTVGTVIVATGTGTAYVID